MAVKSKVVMAETPEQKDSMGTLHTDEDVAEVDAKAKAGTLKHNPRPEGQGGSNGGEKVTSTGTVIQGDAPTRLLGAAGGNPDMQADSAQKTVVNVPEATSGTGGGQEDWRAGLKNPNQHLENYGDDSSLPYQEHPETLGGTSAKYEGEGVKTTSGEEIDRGLTLDQLDPNYKYGQESQIYGSEHDGYIQSRNDRIAIALWNAGIRDPEGIRAWLEKQPGFMNSSEHDRNNTVMSIYKRMGVEPEKEAEWSPEEGEGMNLEDTEGGKIYGKDTPSETNPDAGIKTEVDPLNITNQMNATREANVKAMLSMKPTDIGAALAEGVSVCGGEQTLRDIKQFYPSFYAQIEDAIKQYNGQKDIDSITTTGTVDATSEVEKSNDVVNNGINDWVNKNSDERTKYDVQTELTNSLSQNQTINGARGQLNEYKEKIADLQQKIANLPTDARKLFKSDVPQYLINAVVANRTQKYQSEISKYQSLYAATLDEVKMEIAQQQWQQEFDLKKKQFEVDSNYKAVELGLGKYKAIMSTGKWNDDGTFTYIDMNGNAVTASAEQVNEDFDSNADLFINNWLDKLAKSEAKGLKLYGGQCEKFTDDYARQFYGTSMVMPDGSGVTTAERKAEYATIKIPKKGLIAVFNYPNSKNENSRKYGHTAIVTDYDKATGLVTYMDSNSDGLQSIAVHKAYIGDLYDKKGLVGFRDPSGISEQKSTAGGYKYFNHAMTDIFAKASEGADVNLAKDIRIANAGYAALNEMMEEGYVEDVVKLHEELGEESFSEFVAMLKTDNFVDAKTGVITQIDNTVLNSLIDKFGKGKGERLAYLFSRLRRLVEIKLRRESGAAINASEWMGNFMNYLPQTGQSPELIYKQISALEKDGIASLLPPKYAIQYIPILPTWEEYSSSLNSKKKENESKVANMAD